MAVPNVAGEIIPRLRAERSFCVAQRFRVSTAASGPPPWALQARRVPLPEPDRGFRKPAPSPTERRARLPVRGVPYFGGMQS